MKSFACGAVVPGCIATFHADTDQGILEQVAAHARDDHGMIEIPDELVGQVCSHIQTTA